mmetsp:Transcript_22494/g.58730  ORF Transcript_22494/g.58730 Transcript_22494/m.58730 type:complete len:234 (-) Transcript_22494:584-1285(-)
MERGCIQLHRSVRRYRGDRGGAPRVRCPPQPFGRDPAEDPRFSLPQTFGLLSRQHGHALYKLFKVVVGCARSHKGRSGPLRCLDEQAVHLGQAGRHGFGIGCQPPQRGGLGVKRRPRGSREGGESVPSLNDLVPVCKLCLAKVSHQHFVGTLGAVVFSEAASCLELDRRWLGYGTHSSDDAVRRGRREARIKPRGDDCSVHFAEQRLVLEGAERARQRLGGPCWAEHRVKQRE